MTCAEPSYVSVAGRGVLAFVGRHADRTVIRLRGTYDQSSVTALAELMARAIAVDDGDLVVDLHQVQRMDVASAEVLVRVREFLSLRSRSLVLRSPARSTGAKLPTTERVGPLNDEDSPKPTTPRNDADTQKRDLGVQHTLIFAGSLDLLRVGDLRRMLLAATKEAHDTVRVDLSQVSYIDSSCIGALLYANRVAAIHGCTLALIAPSPACLEALEQRGVSVLFTISEASPTDAATGCFDGAEVGNSDGMDRTYLETIRIAETEERSNTWLRH